MTAAIRPLLCLALALASASCGGGSAQPEAVPGLSDAPTGYWLDAGTGVSIDVRPDKTYTICDREKACEQGVWRPFTGNQPGEIGNTMQIVLTDVGEKQAYRVLQAADPLIPVFTSGLVFGKNTLSQNKSDICSENPCMTLSDADHLIVIFVKRKNG